MNVHAVVTVGTFTAEAHVEDCGPDALHDCMHQVVTSTLVLVGADALAAAAGAPAEDE